MKINLKWHTITIWVLTCLLTPFSLWGQFPPAAGEEGSTAISAESDLFVNWATACTVERGWRNILQTDTGKVSYGSPVNALGKADNEVVSLGDGGMAIVKFDFPVTNGTGADFAVFENGFDSSFLELAFVEVSSDGIHFFRFPAISNTDTNEQVGTFGTLDPTKIHNLAGKYEVGYGTPFDLEEMVDIDGLDVSAITHVKLIDVVGSIDETIGNFDANGHIVNDPFPTPFESGGFDLDAVGVIHEDFHQEKIKVIPNPIKVGTPFTVKGILRADLVRCFNVVGQEVRILKNGNQLTIPNAAVGVYFLVLDIAGDRITVKLLVTI